jgi:outer membrane lipoprotein-sorting protein
MAGNLLARAIAIRYDCDSRARIDLRMRDGRGGERHRRIRTVAKHIHGRMHSIGRLIAPQHLRGMTFLSIEARDRTDDVFVYLPSLGRVRRVSMSRRADSFLGSDLTYGDFDRQRAEDYRVESLAREVVEKEPVHVITARPKDRETYHRVAFVVAVSDLAILELRYYKAGGVQAFRVVRFPRTSIRRANGNLIPTRIHVANTIRGSETDVEISELEVNPEIDDRLFSIVTLRAERELDAVGDARKRTRLNTP